MLTRFWDINAEVTNVKQAQKCGDCKGGRRDGCGLVLEGNAQRSSKGSGKSEGLRGRVLVLREERPQETKKWWPRESRSVQGNATARVLAEARKGWKQISVRQVGAHVERLQVQGNVWIFRLRIFHNIDSIVILSRVYQHTQDKVVAVAKVPIISPRSGSIVVLLSPTHNNERDTNQGRRMNQRCAIRTKTFLQSNPHACVQTAVKTKMLVR